MFADLGVLDEELAGEAMEGGPLMLSWADVLPGDEARALPARCGRLG